METSGVCRKILRHRWLKKLLHIEFPGPAASISIMSSIALYKSKGDSVTSVVTDYNTIVRRIHYFVRKKVCQCSEPAQSHSPCAWSKNGAEFSEKHG